MRENHFQKQFDESIRLIEEDKKAIKRKFPDVIDIQKTEKTDDLNGVDYKILLRNGDEQGIDVKRREPGASYYWQNYDNPDLPLEIWSVKETKKIGWTLGDGQADYILFLYEMNDSPCEILLPFKLLKMAFYHNGREWARKYGIKKQYSRDEHGNRWTSEAVFVPAAEIKKTITELLFTWVGASEPAIMI